MHQPNLSSEYTDSHKSLVYFFKRFEKNETISSLSRKFNELISAKKDRGVDLINLYDKAIHEIETLIWQQELSKEHLATYQQLFHAQEILIEHQKHDARHRFIITIPVADRPQHLKTCLQSLLDLCKKYRYGGVTNNKYSKIHVLIADDSKLESSKLSHQQLVTAFSKNGLSIEYFGAIEQQAIIKKNRHCERKLDNIIGNIPSNTFYHKGASITRNIAYLKLNEFRNTDEPTLFYFIDSDQEFKVKIKTHNDEVDIYAINYFYYLDRLFSRQQIDVLTGKVVGDPPVSPSVMAGNFLEDLIAFTSRISKLEPHADCTFHNHDTNNADDAAYHDMADLFGFKSATESFQYNCMIKGQHDHIKCFIEISQKLNQFFDGEHPTRKSYYEYEEVETNIKPARTIYTGNYIFNENGLQYFIPFANLKFRMAGPVLGRIIKSDIGDRFVSANLPMLHKRTIDTLNQSEFRPGVEHKQHDINLSGEFSRQFYGDVMLFSMQSLAESGYPHSKADDATITQIVAKTIASMKAKYDIKHSENIEKINRLKTILNDPSHWWNTDTNLTTAKSNFDNFIHNIEINFGKDADVYNSIFSDKCISKHQSDIVNALISYTPDRALWGNTLDEAQP